LKHQRSYFPLCILNWPNEKICKSDESAWSSFQYIRNKLPVLSQAKLKEGIFVGPQINKLLKDEEFDHTLSGTENVV